MGIITLETEPQLVRGYRIYPAGNKNKTNGLTQTLGYIKGGIMCLRGASIPC
jgi:hypothetical protein